MIQAALEHFLQREPRWLPRKTHRFRQSPYNFFPRLSPRPATHPPLSSYSSWFFFDEEITNVPQGPPHEAIG